MSDIIIDLEESDNMNTQLTISINFISSKDAEEEYAMQMKNGNTEFMSSDNVNVAVDELFKSLVWRYQNTLETSMTGSGFIFDSVQLLSCNCHKGSVRRGGSYVNY